MSVYTSQVSVLVKCCNLKSQVLNKNSLVQSFVQKSSDKAFANSTVILMAQSLSCKYRSTFSNSAQDLSAATTAPSVSRTTADHQQCPAGPWDLIIKIASAKG